MKKYILLVLLLCCFLVTGCDSKETHTAKTLNDFEEVSNKYSLNINDNMLNYTDKNIVGAKVAKIDNEQIEMVIYNNAESAKEVQDKHIEGFMNIRNTMVTMDKDKGANYYSFKMVSNNYYWVSSRIDNTLIFTKIPVDYKDTIDNILNDLGY